MRSFSIDGTAIAVAALLVTLPATTAWADATPQCNDGSAANATECGTNATTGTAINATAVGANTTATGPGSIAIGGPNPLSGVSTSSLGLVSIAIGAGARTTASAVGVAIGPSVLVDGIGTIAIGGRIQAVANQAIAIGGEATPAGATVARAVVVSATGGIALGAGAQVGATGTGGVALGQLSTASGAGAIAIGNGASASADNSVALGQGSVASQVYTVSVGASGAERRITNLAAGTSATDAVNLGQLNALGAQFGALQSRFDLLEQRQASSTAVAVAMGGAVFLPNTKFSLTANVATYDGAHAGALQISALVSEHLALNAGVATGFNKHGRTAGRVGFTVGW